MIATVSVKVDPNLPSGIRDVSLGRATAERSIAVYDKIVYIKVTPDASMARLGGTIAAKQFAQFEAIIDQAARTGFLETHHLGARYDCHTCWSRPTCAGGCYHEAFIHYGDTSAANLHYCDWIRGWNGLCLRIYGEISVRNPAFLDRFNDN
jgi:radical SAM protein with 4Fe4S-binding SPASM domain